MKTMLTRSVVTVLCFAILGIGSPVVAEAGLISTFDAIDATQRAANRERVDAALARVEVREKLSALGVDAAQLDARVAALTDAELATLADRIDTMPAGAGAIEVIGIVFLVLLILEAVGVIDIFKKFP
jgi:hypothetical protein